MGSTFYKKRYRPALGRARKRRPKTFKTEAKAKEYVQKQGLKDYQIDKLQENKFRVRA